MAAHEAQGKSEGAVAAIGCNRLEVPAVEACLWLAWNEAGLCRVLWCLGTSASRPSEIDPSVPELPIPETYATRFGRYFAGQAVDPADLPVDLRGTDFQCRVWNALRRIPRGAVRSYASVASDVGSPRGMRAVGMANASNVLALVVPCHRVVDKDMSLGGYTPGVHIKRYLLALEGVRVVGEHVHQGQLPLI